VGHVVHSSGSGEHNGDALFFMLGWDQYGFDKKHAEAHYAELVLLRTEGSAGHVVHSAASVERDGDALFSCSVGTSTDSTIYAQGHVTRNTCFCILWDLWVM
jgi:hypothetical protein